MKLYFVDLFCGAGGVTTGIHEAEIEGKNIAEVIACVNHDPVAIESHKGNHADVLHFVEDVRTLDLTAIISVVQEVRNTDKNAVICLWASLECTNFSRAKGGMPRNADSRTLAEHLYRYIECIKPDSIWIENVEEFMSWGPLDENGKPINKKAGSDYIRWVNKVEEYGFKFGHKILNAADFGAFTSRKRFFAQFQRFGLPIVWPEPTHSKKPFSDAFGSLEKWKPVKEVLDFKDEGKSIFERPKALSNKTLERIYAGLIKYVAGGKDAFMLKYNSMSSSGKHVPPSVDEPCPTIACQPRLGVVQASFLQKYFTGKPENQVLSVNDTAGALTCIDHHSLVNCNFIHSYYGNGDNNSGVEHPCPTLRTKDGQALIQPKFILNYQHSSKCNSIEAPSPTITTKDKYAVVQTKHWIDKQHSSGQKHHSVEQPAGSILTVPKMNLVNVKWLMNTNYNNVGSSINDPAPVITANRKHHYIVNPSWQGNNGSVDEPCCTLVARQDKVPLYVVAVEKGEVAHAVYENDSEIMIKIKEFMVLYGIVDIKMRMLKILELLKIQGFPDNYFLAGSQAHQKKFIGNSVVPLMATALIKASYTGIKQAA